jgi:hypothetical protein
MPVLHDGIRDVLPFVGSGLQEGSEKILGKHRGLFLNVLKTNLEKVFSETDQYIPGASSISGNIFGPIRPMLLVRSACSIKRDPCRFSSLKLWFPKEGNSYRKSLPLPLIF